MPGGGIGTGKSGIVPTDDIVDGLDDIDITGDVASSARVFSF
jgi:hypothetical protein